MARYRSHLSEFPDSTVKVTSVTPCGDNKVCITMELVVDVNRLADVGSNMLSIAAKGIAAKKKK